MDNIYNVVTNFCVKIYAPFNYTPKPVSSFNPDLVYKILRENGLLPYVCSMIRQSTQCSDSQQDIVVSLNHTELHRICHELDVYLKMLKNTLMDLNRVLEDRFVVIKTIYPYPKITRDVDILVRDLGKATRRLLKLGYIITFKEPPYKVTVKKHKRMSVTLHEKISWRFVVAMDEQYIFKTARSRLLDDIEIFVPGNEAEILVTLAHAIFESQKLTLGDVLYVYRCANDINVSDLLLQTRAYNWFSSFRDIVAILNYFHLYLYRKRSPLEKVIPLYMKADLNFPYYIPTWLTIKAHIEKKAFEKTLSLPYYIKNMLTRYMKINNPSPPVTVIR